MIRAEFASLPVSRVTLAADPDGPAPYAVMLHNDTPARYIVGYSVSWERFDAGGRSLDRQVASALNGIVVLDGVEAGLKAPGALVMRPGEGFALWP